MSIMDSNNFSYPEKCAQGFPGWSAKGYRKKIAEVKALKDSATKWADKVQECKKSGDTAAMREAALKFGEYKDRLDALNKAILSGDAFVNQSVERLGYTPAEYDFSLGDYSGRHTIDANRAQEPMDNYNDTAVAEEVAEGKSSTPKMLTDGLSMVSTDSADKIHFDDTLYGGTGTYNDDPETMDKAIGAAHTRHFVNAENKKALEILIGSKDAVALAAESLQITINASLCGKAKRNAIIITNKSGFAKLDIDVNGVPLVTKDPNSNMMIYKKKYPIVEVPDEILPDGDNGPYCIVGDIKNVLRFYVIRDTSLFKDDIYPYLVGDRMIREEIITLTTTSDSAYIVGYLA